MYRYFNSNVLNHLTLFTIVLSVLSQTIWLYRVSAILIFLLCLCLSKKEKSILNPYLLFSVTPISILIYHNFGDLYMVDLTPETWGIAIINMYVFVFSLWKIPEFRKVRWESFKRRSLVLQSFVFYMLSLLAVVIAPLASILWMFAIVAFVCALKTRNRMMLLFAIAIFLISAFGMTSKSAMLTYSMAFLICYEKFYAKTDREKKRIKWLILGGVCFMIFSFSFANKDRGDYNADEGLENYSKRGIEWEYDSNLFMPYMYLTNGWTNLQHVMETQDERTYGLWMVKPILGYLQVEDEFKREYKLQPYSTFNTYTYITCGFKDFGYWLSIIMSAFLGFFVKKVYSRYTLSESPYDVACYVLVAQATLEMFFSNHFFTLSYPFTIVILIFIVRLFVKGDYKMVSYRSAAVNNGNNA